MISDFIFFVYTTYGNTCLKCLNFFKNIYNNQNYLSPLLIIYRTQTKITHSDKIFISGEIFSNYILNNYICMLHIIICINEIFILLSHVFSYFQLFKKYLTCLTCRCIVILYIIFQKNRYTPRMGSNFWEF